MYRICVDVNAHHLCLYVCEHVNMWLFLCIQYIIEHL